jgi:sugar phosphate isomerase/epimerase
MSAAISRREILTAAGAGLLAGVATEVPAGEAAVDDKPFRFCLNTATIRGQKVGIVREIDIAAEAGFDAIEPWMDALHAYVQEGGALADLRKRIADRGITVESAIGFAPWIVDDDEARRKGLEQARKDMDVLAQIGARRIAAPPAGAQQQSGLDLSTIAARYRTLLELGDQMGVVPQVEVWGHSKTLGRLCESVYVAVGSRHPRACILPDVYHLYKGDSGFETLKLLSGIAVQVFHMNDYPAEPPRETITDAHRVYPGDGVAPLGAMLKELRQAGFRGYLSLELFNREYWKQDPLVVAKTGLQKMRAAVKVSLS